MEAKKAEPRDSRTPSVIGGNSGMGRGMQAMQNPYASGNVKIQEIQLRYLACEASIYSIDLVLRFGFWSFCLLL